MVKFAFRWIKKRYKRENVYRYKKYLLYFPARFNKKIEPLLKKEFEFEDFSVTEIEKKQIAKITLSRYKPDNETANQTPDK